MKKFSIEIKWALIFTAATLIWNCIEKLSGLHDIHIDKQPLYTNIFAIPAVIIFVLALQEKKKAIFNGQMTWTQGFVSGTVLAVFIAILNPLVQYVTYEVISPDFFRLSVSNMMAHKATAEVAEAIFNLKNYMIQGTLGGLSMGIITSAVVALFVKTKPEPSNEK